MDKEHFAEMVHKVYDEILSSNFKILCDENFLKLFHAACKKEVDRQIKELNGEQD